jgi:uncharacterized membrane protein
MKTSRPINRFFRPRQIKSLRILIMLLRSFAILKEPFSMKTVVGDGLILMGLLVMIIWK